MGGGGCSSVVCAWHAQGSGFYLQHQKEKRKTSVYKVLWVPINLPENEQVSSLEFPGPPTQMHKHTKMASEECGIWPWYLGQPSQGPREEDRTGNPAPCEGGSRSKQVPLGPTQGLRKSDTLSGNLCLRTKGWQVPAWRRGRWCEETAWLLCNHGRGCLPGKKAPSVF